MFPVKSIEPARNYLEPIPPHPSLIPSEKVRNAPRCVKISSCRINCSELRNELSVTLQLSGSRHAQGANDRLQIPQSDAKVFINNNIIGFVDVF